jgi:hypothetical protein
MNTYPETPGWDLKVTLVGTCGHCGADLSGETRVRATTEWVTRYYHDEAFQRTVNQSITRIAKQRHQRACLGERVAARRQAAWAVPA